MERLTELKVGTLLPIEVLNAWAAAGDNIYYGQWHSYTNVFKVEGDTKVSKLGSSGSSFYTEERGVDNRYNFNLVGFIEFYNKFYNLDNQPMKTKLEDWNNCVFYVSSDTQSTDIINRLALIGFSKDVAYRNNAYIRTRASGNGLSRGDSRSDWRGLMTNPREFEYEEAIAALSGSQSTKSVRTNFDNCQVVVTTEQIESVINRLTALGYQTYENAIKNLKSYNGDLRIYIISKSHKIEHDRAKNQSYLNQTLVTVADIMHNTIINTNNTPLNTKTNGKAIIVSKPDSRVSTGQRPKGHQALGKTSRVAVTVGHIRNRAVNC